MTLRSRKMLPCCAVHSDSDPDDDGDDEPSSFLRITTTSGLQQFEPWSSCDMTGLTDGANKWITALEEGTAKVTLASEDSKALNIHVMGGILLNTHLGRLGVQSDNSRLNQILHTIICKVSKGGLVSGSVSYSFSDNGLPRH